MSIQRAAGVLILAVSYAVGSFGACKPDFASQDKITKQPVVRWIHNLTARGFWKSMVVSDIDLIVVIGRYGDMNAVNVEIVNTENDRDRAAFDSRYRGAVGDRFIFGFKDAQPITFIATEVNNQSQIQNAKGLVMNVVLSARVTDTQLATFRQSLTTHEIDAVRVALSSGMIERSIAEEHGETMLQKFTCFFEYLDKRGVQLTARTDEPPAGTPTPPDQKLDLVVEDILAQDKLTLQAILRHDTAYLDRHIADDAIFTSGGKRMTKRMLIAQIMEQQPPPGPVRSRHSAVSSTSKDDIVAVTVTTTLSIQAGGQWRDFYEVRGTTKYKKVDGEWVMIEGSNEYEKRLN